MELHEAGRFEFWTRVYQKKYTNATYCLNEAHKRREQRNLSKSKTKITLNNFSGAFYVLALGYFISFVCFVRENICFRLNRYNQRQKKNNVRRKALTPKATDNHPPERGHKLAPKIFAFRFVLSEHKERVLT
jgi:hypothetical protein